MSTAAPMRRARNTIPLSVKIAMGFVVLFVAFALFGHALTPHGFRETSLFDRLVPPGSEGYLLGTDARGRDLLARLVTGAQITLVVSIMFYGGAGRSR